MSIDLDKFKPIEVKNGETIEIAWIIKFDENGWVGTCRDVKIVKKRVEE